MDRSKELVGRKLVRNQESTIEKIAIFLSFLNIVSLYWLTKVVYSWKKIVKRTTKYSRIDSASTHPLIANRQSAVAKTGQWRDNRE